MLTNGTKVRTTEHAGANDWADPARPDARWGVEGTIVGHSNSHGLVYDVVHDCGGSAWYEPEELELV